MKRLLLVTILLPFCTGISQAQFCRGREFYHAPAFNYYQPTHYQQQTYYYPKAVEVAVGADYYFSVRDYYRDTLLADAIAYRVLMGGKTIGQSAPQAPVYGGQPAQGAAQVPGTRERGSGTAPALAPLAPLAPPGQVQGQATAVDEQLQKVVQESCVRCHSAQAPKAGVNLSDLATVPAGVRWACHGLVNSGDMPPNAGANGKALPDATVKLFYDWARSAGGTKVGFVHPTENSNEEVPTGSWPSGPAAFVADARRGVSRSLSR